MAGDWIKLEHATPEKPEVYRLARLLKISRGDAFLLTVEWWIWLDRNSSYGDVTQMFADDIDALMHCPGFALGMKAVGWLDISAEHSVSSTPNFSRHNGKTAKNRALSKNRMQENRGQNVAVPLRECSLSNVTNASPEKRREELKTLRPNADAFDPFWTAYPRKEKKPAARKAFEKLHPDGALLSRMLSALELLKRSPQWQRDGGNYIPHASSWLNQRRWEDESPTVSVSTHAKKVAL